MEIEVPIHKDPTIILLPNVHKSDVAMEVLMHVICMVTHGAAGKLSDSRLQTRNICYSNSNLNVASPARRHPRSFDIQPHTQRAP
jgi:hypothetical protein